MMKIRIYDPNKNIDFESDESKENFEYDQEKKVYSINLW